MPIAAIAAAKQENPVGPAPQIIVDNQKLIEENEALKSKEEYARKTLIESQTKWTSFCRGILGICKALLAPEVDPTLRKDVTDKVTKYEKILCANEDDLKDIENRYNQPESQPSRESYPKFSSHSNNPPADMMNADMADISQSLSMISQIQTPPILSTLNFIKIKEFLNTVTDEIKICALLQALRWRMTRAKHGEPRREVIKSYVENDLLGLNDHENTLLKKLVLSTSHKIVEYIVCFLNVLASEGSGATYLVKSEELMKLLLNIMIAEQGDTNLRQNALGALQKFSLHRTPQTIMINNGCIEWISEVMKNESETLSDYTFEYITALLMNLALRTAGKKVCEKPELLILKSLLDHIEHENLQVRTYINGTLYSLLTRPVIREQAKSFGMDEMINHMLANSDEQIGRQLAYILNQLNSDQAEECVSDDNEDVLDYEDDENYETENEEEVDEEIINSGVAVGEQLLQEFAEGDIIPPEYSSPAKSLNKTNNIANVSTTSRNLPSAMRSRPKIPRTPISQEMLNIIRKENESILKSATHIYRNEAANKKKGENSPNNKTMPPLENLSPDIMPVAQEEQKIVAQPGVVNPIIKVEEEKKITMKNVAPAKDVPAIVQPVTTEVVPESVKKEEPKKEETKKSNDPMTQTQEFKFAFTEKPKIPRTPPKKDKIAEGPMASFGPPQPQMQPHLQPESKMIQPAQGQHKPGAVKKPIKDSKVPVGAAALANYKKKK